MDGAAAAGTHAGHHPPTFVIMPRSRVGVNAGSGWYNMILRQIYS
jgi:hypothetical protein